ncbi:MAG: hypothetical protein JFAIHJKO_02340 [Pyrinomonadaceae bacterium]|nr:hypothetical protein [Pyrinomonadaceae bacterium]
MAISIFLLVFSVTGLAQVATVHIEDFRVDDIPVDCNIKLELDIDGDILKPELKKGAFGPWCRREPLIVPDYNRADPNDSRLSIANTEQVKKACEKEIEAASKEKW